jgi:xanthine dehydrogenase small subunit
MVRFELDGREVTFAEHPTTTLLQWLRATGRVGTKEGCAEGDCGACSVVVSDPTTGRWRVVNSCLVPVPSVAGLQVRTVEGLPQPHPAQTSLVTALGSQCGFCTPGFVMTLFEACHRTDLAPGWKRDDQLCGNLCRCTGYRPIRDALDAVAGTHPDDGLTPRQEPFAPVALSAEGGTWSAPTEVSEAVAFLAAHPDATVISGATDLGLQITQRHTRFPALLDVGRLHELRGVSPIADGVRLGAATPLVDLEDWSADALPVLHRMLRFFGSRQIKHRATLGGNLCNASPIGDLPPVVLALGGTLVLRSVAGERRVPADAFFEGYRRTARRPDELLVAVELPTAPTTMRLGAYKVSRRRELDISVVSACFAVDVDAGGIVTAARLAYGGVAATPIRATAAERALLGQPWTEAAVDAASALLRTTFTPLTDHRGTAEYRHRLAANLLRGFFDETRTRPFVALSDRPTATVSEAL